MNNVGALASFINNYGLSYDLEMVVVGNYDFFKISESMGPKIMICLWSFFGPNAARNNIYIYIYIYIYDFFMILCEK